MVCTTFQWRLFLTGISILSAAFLAFSKLHSSSSSSLPHARLRHLVSRYHHEDQLPFEGLPSSPDRPPLYYNLTKIAENTRPFSNVVAPKHFWHLEELNVRPPFDRIWGTSAFVDTRPMAVGRVPDLLLLATGESELARKLEWMETPLYCYMAMRRKHGRTSQEMFLRTPAIANALPDAHIDSKTLVAVFFTCPISDDDGKAVDWEDSEIFVTLSPRDSPPPADVFLPVRHLPIFNPEQHRTGHGDAAVCLQPITGDIYANSMRDFMAFYRVLGFTQFYAYVLDPGPETIAIMRDLEKKDGFIPVRWMLPRPWLASQRPYLVNPKDWKLESLEKLSDELEYRYAYSNSHDPAIDVITWSYAQNAAHHDCSLRAMANGARWTAMIDWDEFLLLRPPSGTWPPPSTLAGVSLFTEWARTVDAGATSQLPSAFQFQSSFVCSTCQPVHPPEYNEALQTLEEKYPAFDPLRPTPAIPSMFTSAVRHREWFPVISRSKTIVDPWAWFMRTIHLPIVPYHAHALSRCSSKSSWGHQVQSAEACADPFRSFFRSISSILPPPNRTLNNETIASRPSQFAMGAMYHIRYSPHLTQAQTTWQSMAVERDLDIMTAEEGVDLLAKARVGRDTWPMHMPGESQGSDIVEDWSLLETMGAGLQQIMEDREAKPVVCWTGQKWVKARVKGFGVRARSTISLSAGASLTLAMSLIILMVVWRHRRPKP